MAAGVRVWPRPSLYQVHLGVGAPIHRERRYRNLAAWPASRLCRLSSDEATGVLAILTDTLEEPANKFFCTIL